MAKQIIETNPAVFWDNEMWKLLYKVIDLYPDDFSSDQCWRHFVLDKSTIPSAYFRKKLGPYIRSLHCSGKLVRTEKCKISSRPGHSSIPIYRKSDLARQADAATQKERRSK